MQYSARLIRSRQQAVSAALERVASRHGSEKYNSVSTTVLGAAQEILKDKVVGYMILETHIVSWALYPKPSTELLYLFKCLGQGG
jgi:hypothetical protein